MAELPLAAIADAGPLIHLDQLGELAILDGFATVLVPTIVAEEATRHRSDWWARAPSCLRIEDPEAGRYRAFLSEEGIDAGEAAAFALWEVHRTAVILCDDLAARRYAEGLGCEVAGTLGLLLWAGRSGRLGAEEVRQRITDIPVRTSLHIAASLLERALQALD